MSTDDESDNLVLRLLREIRERVEGVDKKVDAHGVILTVLDDRLERVEDRLLRVEGVVADVRGIAANTLVEVVRHSGRLDEAGLRYAALEARLHVLEAEVARLTLRAVQVAPHDEST